MRQKEFSRGSIQGEREITNRDYLSCTEYNQFKTGIPCFIIIYYTLILDSSQPACLFSGLLPTLQELFFVKIE
jgi:hypothetical protein